MKTTTEKNEVLELLPSNIANSNNFSPKCKYLIATLLFLNGLDKVKNDGYFFRTNQTLANESDMTEKNLLINLRKLESLNFLNRKAGRRGEASEYRIDEQTINSYIDNSVKVKKYTVAKSNDSDKFNDSNNSDSNKSNDSNKLDSILLRISNIENTLLQLHKAVIELHCCNSNKSNDSTDTESDTDIEKESDIIYKLNNNINLNIEKIKTDLEKEVENNETSFDNNSNKTNNSNIPTEEVNLSLEEEVEVIETSSYIKNKIDSDNNSIKTRNDMNKEINKNHTVDIPTEDTNITNSSIINFKATGDALTIKTIEDANKEVIVENNALECAISTEEEKEIDTVQLDIDILYKKIDFVLDLGRHFNEANLPINDKDECYAFLSTLENRCYTEISIYFYNDRILNAGKKYLLTKIDECKETIEYLFQKLDNPTKKNETCSDIITVEEVITVDSSSDSNKAITNNDSINSSISNEVVANSKTAGTALINKTIEGVNEETKIENNALECVVSTTEISDLLPIFADFLQSTNNEYNINLNIDESAVEEVITIAVANNSNKSNNSDNVLSSNDSNKEFNIETPEGFIQFINYQLKNDKMTKEEYKREIDFYKRNYFYAYNSIRELVLPIAA